MYCYRQAAIVVCGSGCNYMQTIGSMSIAHPEARGPTVFYCTLVFLPARRCASAGTSYGPVSVCLSQVGVLSKGMKRINLPFHIDQSCTVI